MYSKVEQTSTAIGALLDAEKVALVASRDALITAVDVLTVLRLDEKLYQPESLQTHYTLDRAWSVYTYHTNRIANLKGDMRRALIREKQGVARND